MPNRGPRTRLFADTRDHWSIMTVYERFEQIVAVALSLIIAIVIVIALCQLVPPDAAAGAGRRSRPARPRGVSEPLRRDDDGADRDGVQALDHPRGGARESIIQVKTVILIAILALSRKFVILDSTATGAATIAALAGRDARPRRRLLAAARARRSADAAGPARLVVRGGGPIASLVLEFVVRRRLGAGRGPCSGRPSARGSDRQGSSCVHRRTSRRVALQ